MKHQKLIYWLIAIFAVIFIGGALIIPTPAVKQRVVTISHFITGHQQTKGATREVANSKLGQKYQLSTAELTQLKQLKVTGIGDSIMVRTTDDLKQVIGTFNVNAKIGRQVAAAPAIITQLQANHEIAKNVLVNLGTNGPTSASAIDGIINQIGTDHEIFWVNTRVPNKKWQDSNNQLIAAAAKKYTNVHLVDWLYVSQDNDNWFADDNLHPNTLGDREYVATVGPVLAKYGK
ncbi:esterase [Lactiplantibacillus sp. WILCCON 0030]|uniref:Esterase n=1 Tax=Lactiplantibacillus brownii TaxID=3069269 RepID=A0ABU1ABJ0_9LACO|nr:esterase [Lactiplantibacillus brownii]MDQ7938290.1 esterase [Lactiplantibacillus brownii]